MIKVGICSCRMYVVPVKIKQKCLIKPLRLLLGMGLKCLGLLSKLKLGILLCPFLLALAFVCLCGFLILLNLVLITFPSCLGSTNRNLNQIAQNILISALTRMNKITPFQSSQSKLLRLNKNEMINFNSQFVEIYIFTHQFNISLLFSFCFFALFLFLYLFFCFTLFLFT